MCQKASPIENDYREAYSRTMTQGIGCDLQFGLQCNL
ncbi:uncharacterized protein METZ01_LOCUS75991 [marine metagenome]|uniref:Uncharacterized protein n=1 Tax=marine metagenome TaxID=408172 RepID=A0A381U6Z9_9ZZZZ